MPGKKIWALTERARQQMRRQQADLMQAAQARSD
jgi:hypothetical protein